jgi:hypothetical protein
MASILFALGLLALLIAVGVAFYWQGSIRLPGGAVAYGVEESIKYITPRLSAETSAVIGQKSVRRILEWEMKFVQSQLDSDPDQIVVLGGDAARSYVLEQTAKEGFEYEPAIVHEVLFLQAEYMASIGAIAEPVSAAELERIEEGQ